MTFGESLAKLMDLNGVTAEMVSKGTGIKKETIQAWRRPCATFVPRLESLKKLADYFMVSLDALVGRQSLSDWYGDLDIYLNARNMCRFYNYEEFLKNNMITHHVNKKYYGTNGPDYDIFELPYPYNIAYDVHPDLASHIFTIDQLRGIGVAMNLALTDREKQIVESYYHDGKTYDEISKEVFVTRERVRQILQKCLRKLRAPAYKELIIFGYEGAEKIRDEAIAKQREAYLAKKLGEEAVKEPEEPKKPFNDITEWDLSVRSFNCLRRAQLETKDKVIEAIKNGDIFKIRNLGVRSIAEIKDRVRTLFGEEAV